MTADAPSLITETTSESKRVRGRPRVAVTDTEDAQREIKTVNDYGRDYFTCGPEPMTRRQELNIGYATRAYDALRKTDDPDAMDYRVYAPSVMTQGVLAELGRLDDTAAIRNAAARLLTTSLRCKGDTVPLLRRWRLGSASPRQGDLYRVLARVINRHMWRYPTTTFDDVRATIYDIERTITHAEGDSKQMRSEGER
jgi:hypothetical protein